MCDHWLHSFVCVWQYVVTSADYLSTYMNVILLLNMSFFLVCFGSGAVTF